MNILIGTTSEQKINIVKDVLSTKQIEGELIPTEVESNIIGQPLDEATTIQGSINRALNAIQKNVGMTYDFSLGLEGGLVLINDNFNLVCAVSIIDKTGNVYTGVSKKTPLPKEVSGGIKNGGEFGTLIREFEKNMTGENDDMKNLVAELINRTRSFSEALESALMQYQHKKYFLV